MQLGEVFIVFSALVIATLSINLIQWRSLQKATNSVVYLSAHHIAQQGFQMMIDGYATLSSEAENAIDASIVSPMSAGRDEALSQLDKARFCWDHLEEQLNIMIYIDAENRKMIRKADWQVIMGRHEHWAKVLRDIAAIRLRHDALRLTHINHGQFQ
jgi:hypothetical protein